MRRLRVTRLIRRNEESVCLVLTRPSRNCATRE
eukprot:COSAG02_NODE_71464_length_191_cov_18.043478_1_plen_32_part_01